MNFDHIILEAEQKDLFIRLAEIVKNIPRENRMKIIVIHSLNGKKLIVLTKDHRQHEIDFTDGDVEILVYKGLLKASYTSRSEEQYIIPPEDFLYYDWLMKQQGKPIERIEKHNLRYFEFEDFQKQYPDAYRKIKQAEEMLWSADKEEQFTTIGHLCREVLQEFADQLYNKVMGEKSNEPKSHDKIRIKAVIESKKKEVGTTVRPFLEALYSYWEALSGLVQRSEHGGQKEAEPVNWEDSHRVVFQTVNVMVELDRTLER